MIDQSDAGRAALVKKEINSLFCFCSSLPADDTRGCEKMNPFGDCIVF